jgi:hypothetical protein
MGSKNKKEDWGPGPWQNEPNKRYWVDQATGLECRILRGPWGSFCGYVGVPKEHPAYGMGYEPCTGDYVDENVEWWRRHITNRLEFKIKDISVHGGLTYAGQAPFSDLHWFGFDCSHSSDFAPGLSELRSRGTYRDIKYVTEEVESLAKQLAAIKREDHEQERAS